MWLRCSIFNAGMAAADGLDFWDVMTGSKPKRLRRASSAGSDHPPQAKAAKAKATEKAKAQPQDLSNTCVSNAPCELLHEVYDQMKEHFPRTMTSVSIVPSTSCRSPA